MTEERGRRGFVYLRRHVDPAVAEAVSALEMDGVYLKPEYRRYYPMGEAASHVLGFTGIDDVGQEGLELAFDGRVCPAKTVRGGSSRTGWDGSWRTWKGSVPRIRGATSFSASIGGCSR